MAGHLELRKEDEPNIFFILEKLGNLTVSIGEIVKDFHKWKTGIRRKKDEYEVMKLSSDYVENKETERAFTIGPFSPKTVEDQDESIAKNIALEVHYEIINREIKLKRVYWVA